MLLIWNHKLHRLHQPKHEGGSSSEQLQHSSLVQHEQTTEDPQNVNERRTSGVVIQPKV